VADEGAVGRAHVDVESHSSLHSRSALARPFGQEGGEATAVQRIGLSEIGRAPAALPAEDDDRARHRAGRQQQPAEHPAAGERDLHLLAARPEDIRVGTVEDSEIEA
jgi:hypothetical protein